MSKELERRVVSQNVGLLSMENYMAEKLVEIENSKLDLLKSDMLIKAYKQLNVRHKNIIDTQRLGLKETQFEASRNK